MIMSKTRMGLHPIFDENIKASFYESIPKKMLGIRFIPENKNDCDIIIEGLKILAISRSFL